MYRPYRGVPLPTRVWLLQIGSNELRRPLSIRDSPWMHLLSGLTDTAFVTLSWEHLAAVSQVHGLSTPSSHHELVSTERRTDQNRSKTLGQSLFWRFQSANGTLRALTVALAMRNSTSEPPSI
ncbi:hypothetical protein LshimejAT787_0904930 [Lyophyllum shimeji]|uniref:Uncharacterized protein n=1 Tax=Lyophyllum shimeji TaxID=47721 RepID=A0A9P3PSK1_LYOSH|nr:hypothetical protein LshimejAT787_0904930 [Lyophyllum shimeji]